MGTVAHEVDYYALLGVDRAATSREIKSAYRSLARSLHPDAGGTAGTFRLLRDAYTTLSDPVARAEYDQGPHERRTATHPPPAAAPAPPRAADSPAPGRQPRSRTRRFGEDPDFVPATPWIDTAHIPWCQDVDPKQRVRRVHRGTRARSGHAPLVGALAGLALLLGLLALPVEPATPLLVVWLLLIAAGAGVGAWLARRTLASTLADRAFAAEFGGRQIYGTAGSEPDQAGERLTADLLARYLGRIPGAGIFHGLAWPDSVFADVDHAILVGSRLVLVESKLWLPGHYTIDATGALWRDNHRFRGGGSRVADGVDRFRTILPHVQVRGVLVIYPSRHGAITIQDECGLATPLMTPETLVTDTGAWLAEHAATVDHRAFRTVREQVVSPDQATR